MNLVQDEKFNHLLCLLSNMSQGVAQNSEGKQWLCVAEDPFIPNANATGMMDSPHEKLTPETRKHDGLPVRGKSKAKDGR